MIVVITVRLKADTTEVMTSDLRKNAAAVAKLLDRNVVPVEQRDEQIGEARVLRILQMLTTLDTTVSVAENRGRQRVVVVPVAVAHVAAKQDRRMIQHAAVGFLRLGE